MPEAGGVVTAAFAEAMNRLGPFASKPEMAVAVSGGADSMALAILARNWASARGGSTLALVVDHGLRAASAHEARITVERLTRLGIAARLLPLSNLSHGAALAERARIMRYQVLTGACREAGIQHLLLGHHAADQIETVAMRVLRGSQTHGLAGMSAVVETAGLLLLRPLLSIAPGHLRRLLTQCGVGWVEDPSNQDPRGLRVRLRQRLALARHTETALLSAVARVGGSRAKQEVETAGELAGRATIRPEGFALLSPGRISPAGLSRLIRTISGGGYLPSPASINELAERLRPATVSGSRITQAGRLGDGWLIAREEASIEPPIEALDQSIWDNRFKLVSSADLPAGAMVGKLGPDAQRFRKRSDLPAIVLRTLPAVRFGKDLAAVPHLSYIADVRCREMEVFFAPRMPVIGSAFALAC